MSTLQERFAKAADASGRKDIEIAGLAKMTRSAISYIRGGTTKQLKAGNGLRLATVLGVNPSWLIDGTGPMKVADKGPGTADNPFWAKNMNDDQVKLTVLIMDHAEHFTDEQVNALTILAESFLKMRKPAARRAREKA
jgi:hypothetical protein